MSFSVNLVYGAVLIAAFMNAAWNALIKHSTDTLMSTLGIVGTGALLAALLLPWLQPPAPASWPYLMASLVLQVLYMRLVARIYRMSDMSISYPVMRGTAPLLVALVSAFLFRDAPGPGAMAGVGLICLGILCIGLPIGVPLAQRLGQRSGLQLALLNAVVIAGYTLVDGQGARVSMAPASYVLWIFLLQGAVMLLMALPRRGRDLRDYLRRHWVATVAGGLASMISYGVALWAMTLAPIAVIAALREISILFAILIAGLFLGERPTPQRIAGTCVLVLGVIVLRLTH